MGCGSSLSQVIDSKQDNALLQTRFLQHQMQRYSSRLFLFGQTRTNRKIIEWDIKQKSSKLISNRVRIPIPKIKYDPLQLLYQQSQQVFNAINFGSSSLPPFNNMFSIYLQENVLFLCGGKDYDEVNFKCQTYLYVLNIPNRPKKQIQIKNKQILEQTNNKKIGINKFQKLISMKNIRYGHTGIYCLQLKSVLIFGGQNQQNQYLKSCQKYNFFDNSWKQMPPMKIGRSNASCFQYGELIYVFGGRTINNKLTKKIQTYNYKSQEWTVLNFKLHRGVQRPFLSSFKNNCIMLIGGNIYEGQNKSVIEIDLKQMKYQYNSTTLYPANVSQCFRTQDNVYVFGNNNTYIERYNGKVWNTVQNPFNNILQKCDFQYFTNTLHNVVVKQQQVNQVVYPEYSENCSIFFGNDKYPCVMMFNFYLSNLVKMNVPMEIRLKTNMAVVQYKLGQYLLCGGANFCLNKISRSTFLYSCWNRKGRQTIKMIKKRHSSGIINYKGYIYIFGGQDQKMQQIYGCQRFNIKLQKWQQIPQLKTKRRQAKCNIIAEDKIVIYGGFQQMRHVKDIQIYNVNTRQFVLIDQKLKITQNYFTSFFCKAQNKIIIFSKNQKNEYFMSKQQFINKKCDQINVEKDQVIQKQQQIQMIPNIQRQIPTSRQKKKRKSFETVTITNNVIILNTQVLQVVSKKQIKRKQKQEEQDQNILISNIKLQKNEKQESIVKPKQQKQQIVQSQSPIAEQPHNEIQTFFQKKAQENQNQEATQNQLIITNIGQKKQIQETKIQNENITKMIKQLSLASYKVIYRDQRIFFIGQSEIISYLIQKDIFIKASLGQLEFSPMQLV